MTAPPVALTIAGSDSGGGAGVQADLKTFHAFGVFGTTAVTAITAQNTLGVHAIQRVDPELVAAQIRAVADDLAPAAAKTGMLVDADTVDAVARALRESAIGHLVVDPVMVAESGDRLLADDAVEALVDRLLPLAEIVTPNVPEAAVLSGRPIRTADDLRAAARALVARGARSVLLKGGHLPGERVVDVYCDDRECHEWAADRLPTRHTHGTGCTLSAAICAGLALGHDRLDAIAAARAYTRRAIETAPGLGAGRGPLNHWTAPPKP